MSEWLLNLIQKIIDYLQGVLDNGTPGSNTSQPKPLEEENVDEAIYAGFSIDKLFKYDDENTTHLLTKLFTHDKIAFPYQEDQQTGGKPDFLLTTIGWVFQFKPIQSSPVTEPEMDYLPVGIKQLVMIQSVEDSGDPIEINFRLFDASQNLKELTTLDPTQLPSYPLTYQNYSISPQGNVENYYNKVESCSSMSMKSYNLYKKETLGVFFSRSQLLMMKHLLEFVQEKSYNDITPKVIFSGYKLNTGRLASHTNMLELETMDNALGGFNNLSEWFSLKAEMMPGEEINVSSSMNNQQPPDGAVVGVNGYDHVTAQNCKNLLLGKVPSIFFGQPCPPGWDVVNNILEEVLTAVEESGTNIDNLEDIICDIIGEIFTVDDSDEEATSPNPNTKPEDTEGSLT